MAAELQADHPPRISTQPRSLLAGSEDAGRRLDIFLARKLGVGRRTASRLVTFARVNGERAAKGLRLQAGDHVSVDEPEPGSAGELEEPVVLRVTADVLVVAKPAGLPTVAIAGRSTPSLAAWIGARFPECVGVGGRGEHGAAHRLDTETSGLLLVARSSATHDMLRAQFRRHEIEKTYLAVVWGELGRSIEIDAPIGQHRKSRRRVRALENRPAPRYAMQSASTRVTPLRTVGPATLVSARTCTGARHQIRAHLAFVGHPLVSDSVHGGRRLDFVRSHLLHASALRWRDPADETMCTDEAPLPAAWEDVLARLADDVARPG